MLASCCSKACVDLLAHTPIGCGCAIISFGRTICITLYSLIAHLAFYQSILQHVAMNVSCRCASVAIVREDEITDGRPPFTKYETMVSKKAFENYSQKYMSSASSSSRSMTHAASASDLAGMGEHQTTQALQTPCSFRQHTPHEKSISEENEDQ